MKQKVKQRAESAVQFDEIYKEHHDPTTREKKRILDNRKSREELIKEDNGL